MGRVALVLSAWIALATPAFADPPSPEVVGPARLCFIYSNFRLEAGERVTDVDPSMHGIRLEIAGPGGAYTVSESNHARTPRRQGGPLLKTKTMTVRRFEDRAGVSYAAFGKADFAPDETRMLARMWGPALATEAGARAVYSRLEIGDPARASCDRSFGYGFPFK